MPGAALKWGTRVLFTILTFALSLVLPTVITLEYINYPYNNYIVSYDKYKEYFWEINVAEIDLEMRRNSDREIICKGTYPKMHLLELLRIRCACKRSGFEEDCSILGFESWTPKSARKWFPKEGLSETERKVFYGLADDETLHTIMVHTVACAISD